MGYGERGAWNGLVTGAVSIIVYLAIILPQLGARPVSEIDWVTPMLWTIGGAIAAGILISIGWSTAARIRDDDDRPVEDVRDRDISRMGSRAGQAFLVIGILGALALCAVQADWFWIAQALYAASAISALVDGVSRVIVYRTGMP